MLKQVHGVDSAGRETVVLPKDGTAGCEIYARVVHETGSTLLLDCFAMNQRPSLARVCILKNSCLYQKKSPRSRYPPCEEYRPYQSQSADSTFVRKVFFLFVLNEVCIRAIADLHQAKPPNREPQFASGRCCKVDATGHPVTT